MASSQDALLSATALSDCTISIAGAVVGSTVNLSITASGAQRVITLPGGSSVTISATKTQLITGYTDDGSSWKFVDLGQALDTTVVFSPSALFVDPVNGSDAAAGGEATPLLTATKAMQIAGDNTDIYLRAGNHPAITSMTGATSRNNYCRIQPYPGEIPVITGEWVLGRQKDTFNNSVSYIRYVELIGLNFANGLVFSWGSSYMRVRGCSFSGIRSVDIKDGVSNVGIYDNTMLMSQVADSYGPHLDSYVGAEDITNVDILRNEIRSRTVGINLRRVNNALVEDNNIYGQEFQAPSGTHTDGIRTFGGGTDLIVRRNKIHDLAAIPWFINDGDMTNVEFSNNLIYNVTGGFLSSEIFDVNGYKFVNNTIIGTVTFEGLTLGARGIVMANNVIVGGCSKSPSNAIATMTYQNYNIITGFTNLTLGANDTTTAPTFIDSANGDYHLGPADTRARNTGIGGTVGGFAQPTLDLDKVTRSGAWDRGSYNAD